MQKRVAPGHARLFDDPSGGRVVEEVEQVVLGVAGDLDEHVEVEVAPDHRGSAERAPGSFRQVVDPPADHLFHTVGHAEGLEREPTFRVRGADLGDVAADLADEERVSLRLASHAPHEVGVGLERARDGAESADVVLAEPRKLELVDDVLAAQVGDGGAQW